MDMLGQGFLIDSIVSKWDKLTDDEKSKYESYEDFIEKQLREE